MLVISNVVKLDLIVQLSILLCSYILEITYTIASREVWHKKDCICVHTLQCMGRDKFLYILLAFVFL